MEILMSLIHVVSGAIAGSVIGGLWRAINLGAIANSALGVVGGVLAGQLLRALGVGGEALDLDFIAAHCASGGMGGAFLVIVIGAVRALNAP